jgi:hypothetical protein
LREKIQKLQFANIPGYFPTPAAVVADMLDAANLKPGCTVLEPSAGSGAILDAVKAANPTARLVAFERHCSLRDILARKGYALAGDDFLESEPAADLLADCVLMNPPFESGQDIEHVIHASRFVRSPGRLVAIMSPGPFYRSDAKARKFRDWFESHGGTFAEIPAGAFKESGTGVATVLITVDL